MNNKQEILFSIRCECSIYKNGLLISNKKKSKFSNLILNQTSKIIQIVPLHSKQEKFLFQLKKLKNIHRKFINEGKITLQFTQDVQKNKIQNKNNQDDQKIQRLSQIFVDAASPQNLQILIKKIVDLKKSNKSQTKTIKKSQNKNDKILIQSQKNINEFKQKQITNLKINLIKSEKIQQDFIDKRKDPSKYYSRLHQLKQQKKKQQKIDRKMLMNSVYKPLNKQLDNVTQIVEDKKVKKQIDMLQLPIILLQKIFQYVKVNLRFRLINKKFNEYVLRNIQKINFKDQVDQQTFNKLAKLAINISGRLKNVKNITLLDKFKDQQPQKNRAKSLYFGQWKQISKNNILHIKFLHLHTLQLPYQIKFQLQNIFSIRLRQLHFSSKSQVTTANNFIKDQSILYLFQNIDVLQSFSIPYINSTLIDKISQIKQKLNKIKSFSFGSINQNQKEQSWFLFHNYENLKSLKVQRILRGGIKKNNIKHKMTFPKFIQNLEIGSILDEQIVRALPTTLHYLKLQGEQYLNIDIQNMFLPYLKKLDISECPLIRPSLIDSLLIYNNLNLITKWQRQDVLFWKELAKQKKIQLVSIDGLIKK